MDHETQTEPENIDAQTDFEGNDATGGDVAENDAPSDGNAFAGVGGSFAPPVERDSRGIPKATTTRTLADIFAEHGIDAKDAALPYFRVKGKPQTIRIVGVEPTPPPRAFRDGTIVTLARLKVEDDEGRQWLLDVTSARLLSQLGSMEDGRWITIAKSGSGLSTIYDVAYAENAA